MKKCMVLIIMILAAATAKSQDSSTYRKQLDSLLSDAKNNFMINRGTMSSQDTAAQQQFFNTIIDLNSTKSFIQKNTDDGSMVTLYYFDWSDWEALKNSMTLTTIALTKINAMNSSGDYKGRDVNNADGSTTTELTDTKGNYVLELTTSEKAKYLKLLIYAKNWGTR